MPEEEGTALVAMTVILEIPTTRYAWDAWDLSQRDEQMMRELQDDIEHTVNKADLPPGTRVRVTVWQASSEEKVVRGG